GPDRPGIVQSGKSLERLAAGAFGLSWPTVVFFNGQVKGAAVGPMVWQALLVTASLVLGGFLLLLLVAIPLGTWCATKPRSFVDRFTVIIGVAAISTHPLVVGLLLQLFIGNRWHLMPGSALRGG